MNILFLSLLYPDDQIAQVSKNAKDKLQNQINAVQHAMISGIKKNLRAGEKLKVVNSLPVGIFPTCYKNLLLRKGWHDNHSIFNLGSFNLPIMKQQQREASAYKMIMKWASESSDNRNVLIYTIYLPYMKAVLRAKKKIKNLKATVIVTDLPNEYGLPSGRTGFLKKLEKIQGNRALKTARELDGFILMTEPMSEVLQLDPDKPKMIMEGIIDTANENKHFLNESDKNPIRPNALYTGTLEPELGIMDLISAFEYIPEADLRICGSGSLDDTVAKIAGISKNIRYYGRIPREEALALQKNSDLLINPRKPDRLFTRYSFPSKTMEYLAAGKPVLCYHLDGIPKEYDQYLCYIPQEDQSVLIDTIRHYLFDISKEEREQIGKRGRDFVTSQKNAVAQGRKMLDFIKGFQ